MLLAERGQHVIGPYSGSRMKNNHSKNGTIFYTCHDGTRSDVRTDRFEHVERDHGRAGVQVPDALVREALHGRLAEGEETVDGPLSRRWPHARQYYSPLRRLQGAEDGAVPSARQRRP